MGMHGLVASFRRSRGRAVRRPVFRRRWRPAVVIITTRSESSTASSTSWSPSARCCRFARRSSSVCPAGARARRAHRARRRLVQQQTLGCIDSARACRRAASCRRYFVRILVLACARCTISSALCARSFIAALDSLRRRRARPQGYTFSKQVSHGKRMILEHHAAVRPRSGNLAIREYHAAAGRFNSPATRLSRVDLPQPSARSGNELALLDFRSMSLSATNGPFLSGTPFARRLSADIRS